MAMCFSSLDEGWETCFPPPPRWPTREVFEDAQNRLEAVCRSRMKAARQKLIDKIAEQLMSGEP